MPTLSAFYNFDSTGNNRGIPASQFTTFQYNTGGSVWYNRKLNRVTNLFGTGDNFYGQLGLGNNTNRNTFTQLTGNWSKVVCGGQSTMALSAGTNRWFGTGMNNVGQLGLGFGTNVNTFNQLPLSDNWSQIVCGGIHTMALNAGTNRWFGTGYNLYGQLGLGFSTNVYTFTQLPLSGNWSQIVCGENHTMAMSAGTNRWFGTGLNADGQLGLGDNTNRYIFMALPLSGNWSQMVCGASHTMAMSAGTNRWFATGWNINGQLGLGDNTSRNIFMELTGNWSQMSCGYYHTMALSAGTNRWFGTGNNGNGQLGLGNFTHRRTFTQLTGNWSQMVCGAFHTMAMSEGTNRWFGTGYNESGQLGLGNNTSRNTFMELTGNWSQVACGGYYTMALPSVNTSPIVIDDIEKKSMNFKIRPVTNTGQIGEESTFNYII